MVKYESLDLLSPQENNSYVQKFKGKHPHIILVEGQQDPDDGNWKILKLEKI